MGASASLPRRYLFTLFCDQCNKTCTEVMLTCQSMVKTFKDLPPSTSSSWSHPWERQHSSALSETVHERNPNAESKSKILRTSLDGWHTPVVSFLMLYTTHSPKLLDCSAVQFIGKCTFQFTIEPIQNKGYLPNMIARCLRDVNLYHISKNFSWNDDIDTGNSSSFVRYKLGFVTSLTVLPHACRWKHERFADGRASSRRTLRRGERDDLQTVTAAWCSDSLICRSILQESPIIL